MKAAFSPMLEQLRGLAVEEDGAQIIEYALIIAVVSLTLILAMNVTDLGFAGWLSRVKSCLTTTTCA
ncbi:MAG: Flp family type IVb pilin [Proteobacteria bacterium]|nr:Flp family type IVb pilin [Pseudomonadota bacterium]